MPGQRDRISDQGTSTDFETCVTVTCDQNILIHMTQEAGMPDEGRCEMATGTYFDHTVIETINRLQDQGLTQEKIGEALGYTQQMISYLRRHHPEGRLTPTQRVRDMWPWDTATVHNKAVPYRGLKLHASAYANGVERLSDDGLQRLVRFYRILRDNNRVVRFDPQLQPYPDMPQGGFEYVTRTEFDKDLMIRLENVVVPITDDFTDLWTFPEKIPSVR